MPKSDFNIADILGAQLANVPELGTIGTDVAKIPVDRIYENNRNFYPKISPAEMEDLMESIDANGVLEPPTVVADTDGQYRLISGHNRTRAVWSLHDKTPEDVRFQTLLCRVLPPMTEAQETTAIIEANRQRVKTPFLIQREVEELTKSYVARKEAGEDLKGRIRDRVAEDMKLSAAHISRLNAIKKNLKVPGFMDDYKKDRLGESVAYEISKLDHEAQYRFLDYSIDRGGPITIQMVKRFSSIYLIFPQKCRHCDARCPNGDRMYDAFYRYGELRGCAGCCEKCIERETCAVACQYIERPPEEQEAPAEPHRCMDDDPRLDNLGQTLAERLTAERTATGKTRREFAESIGIYPATYSAWENGELPGGSRIPALALVLGVSTDYLFGLTDDKTPGAAPAGWLPLDRKHWPTDEQVVILSYENGAGGFFFQPARCVGSMDDQYPFVDQNEDLTLEDWESFDQWIPLAERRADDADL